MALSQSRHDVGVAVMTRGVPDNAHKGALISD